MSDFLEHLQKDHHELYEYGEYTNVTRTIYIAIGAAFYDKADTIIIYPNYFEWLFDGMLMNRHLGNLAPLPQPIYPQIFKLVQKRDMLINQHTKLLYDDEFIKASLIYNFSDK